MYDDCYGECDFCMTHTTWFVRNDEIKMFNQSLQQRYWNPASTEYAVLSKIKHTLHPSITRVCSIRFIYTWHMSHKKNVSDIQSTVCFNIEWKILGQTDWMGLLLDTLNCGLRMRRECRERFPRHSRLAIPTCRDRYLAVSFEVGGGENEPGILAHVQPAILRIW